MARTTFAIAALFMLGSVAPLWAQNPSPSTAAEAVQLPAAAAGPTLAAVSTAARMHAQSDSLIMSPAARGNAGLGQAKAMMVVGVAALLAGAVIGGTPGTVIMIGGAVVGLVGLYDYLQ